MFDLEQFRVHLHEDAIQIRHLSVTRIGFYTFLFSVIATHVIAFLVGAGVLAVLRGQ